MKITLQRTSPNYRQKNSTHKIMRDLTIGLLVVLAWSLISLFLNYSSTEPVIAAALIYVVSVVTGVLTEGIWGIINKVKPLDQIKNGFPWVTAIIFALTLPVGTPLYVVAIGSFLSIFLGKLVFGGFGHNIFNPALVGRVIVHLSFADKLLPYVESMAGGAIDVTTNATPAAMLASAKWLDLGAFKYGLMDLFLGNHGGALGETCIWVILVVGIVLAIRRVYDARITVSYLGTVGLLAAVFALMNGLNPLTYAAMHLCMGGIVFGAVFMATDPVTSPSSPLGKIIFGIALGFLTMIIRLKANYPEGVLFSILIMNMLTPLIDSFVLGRTNQNTSKQIMAIVLSLALSIGCVAGISGALNAELKAEQEAAAEAQKKKEEAAKKAEEAEKKAMEEAIKNPTIIETLPNGYVLETKGFGGDANPMHVKVLLADGQVTSVEVIKADGETEYYGHELIKGTELMSPEGKAFYDKYLAAPFAYEDIDGVDIKTGSTMTTKGIVIAIRQAIELSK